MTKSAALILSNYKKYRDAAKTPSGTSCDTNAFLRDVYRDALSRCRVRVIHGKKNLMSEEPSAELSDFLCKFCTKKSKTNLSSIYGEVHNAEQADKV